MSLSQLNEINAASSHSTKVYNIKNAHYSILAFKKHAAAFTSSCPSLFPCM